MQPRSPFDAKLLIPIGVGAVSILGIGLILLTSDLSESLIPPMAAPTAIPSNVSPLETWTLPPPLSATPTLEGTPPIATRTSLTSYTGPPAETFPSTSTLVTESRPAPSATPAPDQPQPFPAGKYDDMDPNIAYDRYWVVIKTAGTENAYKGALHVSASMGSEAFFRFTGQQFYLGYQRGRNFGTVTVIIDDQSYSFHEQAFDLIWRSPPLSPGTHFVRIIHESGESINLDYIQVLD